MTTRLLDSLTRELDHETRTTRRLLERLPDDKLSWRPHAKSFTAGMLGSHLVDCVRWSHQIFGGDELDLDPATYRPFHAGSVAELLSTYDADVARSKQALAASDEAALGRTWLLKIKGRVQVERPRAEAFRDFTLSHMIHHRGQLSVYLRLLDVPVPGSYGPSADELG